MRRLIATAAFILAAQFISAGEWLIDGCSVFLPEGWLIYSREEPGRISFTDPDQSVIYQITRYPGESYDSDKVMADEHMESLGVGDAELSRFIHDDAYATMGDLSFRSGEADIRGWFLFIDRDDWDYYLAVITSPDNYESALPLMLSCLDGFSADRDSASEPGAVSSLISAADETQESVRLSFPEGELDYRWTGGRMEAGLLLIEREAAILSSYGSPEEFDRAWQRYYQLIMRETAPDLEKLGHELNALYAGYSDKEKAEALLSWLQDFEYGSTTRFSDLLTPTEALSSATGDCDALALVYLILLREMDISGVLMVSRDFGHALAAVAVEGEGAHFSFEETTYYVAEMTKKAALGQIASEQADLSKWVIVPFENYSEGELAFGE